MAQQQGPLLTFSNVLPGEDIGFPLSCLSGYFFLWDSCVNGPVEVTFSDESEQLLKEELLKLKNLDRVHS